MKDLLNLLTTILSFFHFHQGISQCFFGSVYTESFEYTTPIPGINTSKVFHSTPQTNDMANVAYSGERGMYLNIVDDQMGVIYSDSIPNLCIGREYLFTFSYVNATQTSPSPSFRLTIMNANNVVLASDIFEATSDWQVATLSSFASTTSSIIVEIETLIPGSHGNDLAIDDLILKACVNSYQDNDVSLCTSNPPVDLRTFINNPTLSANGIWLDDYHQALPNGMIDPSNPSSAGFYQYIVGANSLCPDSIARFVVELLDGPSIDFMDDVISCGTYILPPITGAQLSSTTSYFTGSGGSGISFQAGDTISSSKELYLYSDNGSCIDEQLFTVTIGPNTNSGSDGAMSLCGPGMVINMNNLLSNGVAPGTWISTAPSFDPQTGIFNTALTTEGTYTFLYEVVGNDLCPTQSSQFTIHIGDFPLLDLGNDTLICPGQSVTLNVASGIANETFLWENNSTSPTRTINVTGTYWVRAMRTGSNLIVNGDFEDGYTAFNTDYVIGTGGNFGLLSNESTYAISSSPSNVHSNFSTCQDHTPNAGTQMMIVNGAANPGTNVWCQDVAIQANTDYEFSTWIANALNNNSVAKLQFSINGQVLGNPFQTSTSACNWQQFFQVWNSGNSTTATICIVNQNTSGSGNDFLIDDISFSPICISTDTIRIEVSPQLILDLGEDLNVCSGDTIELAVPIQDVSSIIWNDGSTEFTRLITESGMYKVSLYNGDLCSKSDSISITFHDAVTAGSDQQAVICNSIGEIDLTTFLSEDVNQHILWQNDQNQGIDTLVDVSQLNGIYLYKIIATSPYCPNDTALLTIDIKHQQSAGIGTNQEFCNTSGIELDLNDFITGNTTAGTWIQHPDEPTFNHSNGKYSIGDLSRRAVTFQYFVSSSTPCLNDTAELTIQINETPIVQFLSENRIGCPTFVTSFINESIVDDGANYFWDFSNGLTSTAQHPIGIEFESSGCYPITLTVSSSQQCTSSLTLEDYICVHPTPIASFVGNTTIIYSDDPYVVFENQSINNHLNEWSFGDGSVSTAEHPIHSFAVGEAGSYEVVLVITSLEGCKDTASRIFKVEDILIFYVPNTFTPNGDEFNPFFKPIIGDGIEKSTYTLEIYNRWGELVYHTNDTESAWDGTYKGQQVQEGVYTWKIKFRNLYNAEMFEKVGHVNLLR